MDDFDLRTRKKRYLRHANRANHRSLVDSYIQKRLISAEFTRTLSALRLEEIIHLKMELSTRYLRGRLIPYQIYRDAIDSSLSAAIWFCRRQQLGTMAMSYVLGIPRHKLWPEIQRLRERGLTL